MRILHFGDIHFWRLRFDWDFYYPKRFLGLANLALRRRHKFPPHLAWRVARAIVDEQADLVVFSGDLSTMSLDAEFRDAAAAFAPLYEKWGERLVVIPGNHDRYTPGSVCSRRYEKHFPHGAFPEGERVCVREFDDGLAVVAVDASRPFKVRSNGFFDSALEEELDARLDALAGGGRRVVLVGHFPYAYPPEVEAAWDHKMLRDGAFAALVARHRPAVYLHGHKHIRWALRDGRTPDTLCLNCGAAGMVSDDPAKQAGWVSFDLGAGGAVGGIEFAHLPEDGGVVRAMVEC